MTENDSILKIPTLEIILFFIAGLLKFPILLVTMIVVCAILGDPLLQRLGWFKKHAHAFPATYKESVYMNGLLFVAYIGGFLSRIVVMP
jgi:hypothetical protein